MMGYGVLFRAALETAKICLPTVIEARRGVLRQEDCDLRLRSWASRVLSDVDAHVEVEGLEHLSEAEGPFVVVSNHQSYYDIPVVYFSLPVPLRMAAKAELFRVPLWGQALRDSNFVRIERKKPERAHAALQEAGERMRASGISLYIAPEGTRCEDGALGPFKAGAFRMARVLEFPILPIAISGTYAIHKKGSTNTRKGCRVRVRVLSPLFADAEEAPESWAQRARQAIQLTLTELERESGRFAR